MKNDYMHITERFSIKNSRNIRARKLLAGFLDLDVKTCEIPPRDCSRVLLRFIKDYNEMVSAGKIDQEKLF